ncbi:MAG TPA: penicillin acylase family protein [Acetobacteraceae bacterium]|nr:penicillin acylase family protein [Acetobacteraceae bacterium]
MQSLYRFLRRSLVGVGFVILFTAALVTGLLWLSLPQRQQQVRIPGLTGPVDIGFDGDGIPRIHASNELDAATALGFVHARDRMFQMDLMRRAASGRLSEIAGAATLAYDRMMRTLGLRQRAVADFAGLPADTRAVLEAYARGVNAWIAARGRFSAPEFVVLGPPEQWQASDSLLWGETMGLWLSLNWRTELSRQALAGRIPQQQIDELWPPQDGGRPEASLLPRLPREFADVLPNFPEPFTLPGSASNEWAVDGRHTATGAPLLAGDPHLAFGFPSIWYLARIETPQGVLAGATAPGVPFLVLGHNGHIAWTFTTTGADVQDIFIETPVGADQYQTPDGPRPFTVRDERIKVRGQADEVLKVRETRHGPVIGDLTNPGGPLLAVQMANLAPGNTAAAGLLALNRAQTVADAGKAAAMITSPVQNLLVADRQQIGLYVTGRVPIRRAGDGAAPVPGDGSHDWTGWASGEQLPHYVAPESGRLVNANDRIAPPDFPVFMGRDWFGDWRATRIRTMLERSNKLTPQDFARMQTDVRSDFAHQVLPTLLSVPLSDDTARRAQSLLRDWDGSMTSDAPQPLIFNAWIQYFYGAVLAKAGVGVNDAGPLLEFVGYVLSPAGTHWCGDDCNALLRSSLADALRDLSARFGAEPAAWRWGNAHPAVFTHPVLRGVPILNRFATLSIPSPGDDSTVDRGGPAYKKFQSVHGAEYRGVYDLADLDRSLFMMAPGQSGNLLSSHARDFLTRWRDGDTITLGPAAAATTATIQLSP